MTKNKRNDRQPPFLLYGLIVLIAALFLPSSAMAHKPLFVEGQPSGFEQAFRIPDASVSYATYSDLSAAGEVDLFAVTLTAETNFYARISVPKLEGKTDFAPAFVLIGPELPTSNTPPNFQLELSSDQGRAIFLSEGEADEFFEPFTQTTLIQRQWVSRALPAGTYYLAIYDPTGKTGKYVLATGEKEAFDITDWLTLPATWWKVRMWYDPAQTWLMIGGAAAAVAGVVYLIRVRRETE